jgi:homoserine O-acetyltransferase/O-succinyltransferase
MSSVVNRPGQATVTFPALALEDGSILAPVTLAYAVWGRLNAAGDNAILLCHALTGDARAHDPLKPDDPCDGWWNPLIGPGRVFDTERYYVVCANVLGGCYGSTGPTNAHPEDGQPYCLRFPHVTVGDMVHAQRLLVEHLGVTRLAAVAGGSLGGLQALEWAIAYPELVERAIVIGAAAQLSTQGIAIDDIARQIIMADPRWQQGNYEPGEGPAVGLALARMLAMLTYTSAPGMQERFGRRPATRLSDWPAFGPRWDVETYLHHQGDKLARRFDANTYLYLTSAMDRYDACSGPDRGPDRTWQRIRARVLAVGISSDWLFPADQVRALADSITAAGGDARYAEITSILGHDAFLHEWDQLDAILRPFLSAGQHAHELATTLHSA